MKLYIQQRVFSIGDKYDVYDEMQNVIYMVQGKIFTIGAQISLFDYNGQELYFIRQTRIFPLPQYQLHKNNVLMADIKREFMILKSKFTISSYHGNFTMEGDIFSMDFQILKDGFPVGAISKRWLSWGDTYELNIYDNIEPDFFVAMVITIDHSLHNDRNN